MVLTSPGFGIGIRSPTPFSGFVSGLESARQFRSIADLRAAQLTTLAQQQAEFELGERLRKLQRDTAQNQAETDLKISGLVNEAFAGTGVSPPPPPLPLFPQGPEDGAGFTSQGFAGPPATQTPVGPQQALSLLAPVPSTIDEVPTSSTRLSPEFAALEQTAREQEARNIASFRDQSAKNQVRLPAQLRELGAKQDRIFIDLVKSRLPSMVSPALLRILNSEQQDQLARDLIQSGQAARFLPRNSFDTGAPFVFPGEATRLPRPTSVTDLLQRRAAQSFIPNQP